MKSEKKEPGWKQKELEEKYSKIAVDFVNSLHKKDFLKLQFNSDDAYIEKILLRLTGTNQSFAKLFDIVSNLSKFPPFAKAIQPFGFTEQDIMRIFMGLFVHIMLEEFEFLKTIMLMITKKKQYGIDKNGKPKKVTGKETLGQLIGKYDEIIPDNKIRENLNNELRNTLGHGKWWPQKLNFCFVGKDERVKQYDIPQLFIQAIQLSTFVKCFYEKGFERATQIKRGSHH